MDQTFLLDNLKMYFPHIFNTMRECKLVDHTEIIIVTIYDEVYLFNNIDKGVRRLPSISDRYFDEEEFRKFFSVRLQTLLMEKCMTQLRLSEETGISKIVLNRYFTGKSLPSMYNAYLISKALNCSLGDFIYTY